MLAFQFSLIRLSPAGVADSPVGTGGGAVGGACTTKSVILCGGTVADRAPLVTDVSASRLITLDDVSCHTCVPVLAGKLEMLMVIGVLPERTLLITMIVSAPSAERTAPKAE